MQKKRVLIKLSTLAVVRAQYMKKLSTEEYKKYARKRNGVEGIPSILRRRYDVDHMPVRGLLRSKLWFGFKIGAINVKRVIAALFNHQSVNFLPGFFRQKLCVLAFADHISLFA